MPVPQHVLNWLYSVLTSEYQDVNRTYNDIAQALSSYPGLSPRTDVHTFVDGTSALLVHLSGTLPITFRGATYRFPISVWVPHAYPRAAPLVYVTPTEKMFVRPGQHVDPQGQVYHPYLAAWPSFWDKSTLLDFLTILTDVFAKEPPVISRPAPPLPQQDGREGTPSQAQPLTAAPTSPPVVSPKPIHHDRGVGSPQPPPPPPKPTARVPSPPLAPNEPPKPPPKPASHTSSRSAAAMPPGSGTPQGVAGHSAIHASVDPSLQTRPSRYDSAPPLPQEVQRQATQPRNIPFDPRWAPPLPHEPQLAPSQRSERPAAAWERVPYGPTSVMDQQPQPQPQSQQTQPAQRAPAPNFLDEPLETILPRAKDLPPPPIPPNPEKDALLRQLAKTLYIHRQRAREQNESCMMGLQAQRTAMAVAYDRLNAERTGLSQVSTLLASNTQILHDALRKADGVIESSQQHTKPNIDELLVAPTVVANQLYALVAEERAIADVIFVLSRAVERGRISPTVFAKTTRGLSREWYLKKALVKKIGRGMGLAM